MSDTFILLSLLALCYAYYAQYVPSVIQRTRAELFEVRDFLMQKAIAGEIKYEDKLHLMLRDTLNHLIGVTHRLSWFRTYTLARSIRKYDAEDFAEFQSALREYLMSKPSSQRAIYKHSMQRIDRVLIRHMNTVSLPALIITGTAKFSSKLLLSLGVLNSVIKQIRALRKQAVDALDFNAGSFSAIAQA